jgi:hypothetical protein
METTGQFEPPPSVFPQRQGSFPYPPLLPLQVEWLISLCKPALNDESVDSLSVVVIRRGLPCDLLELFSDSLLASSI